MTWPQAEKAVLAGKAVRHRYWKPGAKVVMWRGHMLRISRHGNVATRRWFKPPAVLWNNHGWELVGEES